VVSGLFKRNLFIPYLAFQLGGGLLAGLTLKLIFGAVSGSGVALGSTELSAGATQLEGLALEVLGTFVLAFSALSASAFVTGRLKQAALVGSTLFFLILLIGPITGASFNPARSIGPSIFSGYYSNQIIYWIGPTLGAVLAGLAFRAFRTRIGVGGENAKKNIDIVCLC
jgi:glycerol uptake facilitator-like aquaporin